MQRRSPARNPLQLGNSVADHGIEGDGGYTHPRAPAATRAALEAGRLAVFETLPSLEALNRSLCCSDRTVLPIQGPPGSGKTLPARPHDHRADKEGEKKLASPRVVIRS